jgi:hypothetical protein
MMHSPIVALLIELQSLEKTEFMNSSLTCLGNIVKLAILNKKRNLAAPRFEPGSVRSEVDRANHYSIKA